VTEVYVDVGAASIEVAAGAGSEPQAAPPPADPEAVKALRYLAEAGVRVVIVTAGGSDPSPELRAAAVAVLKAVPERPEAPAWYLTNDIERCQGSSARLRTVYIGGTPPSGLIRRCDTVARDVQAAAMEILAADAMAPAH
jgi:hypothetical protein